MSKNIKMQVKFVSAFKGEVEGNFYNSIKLSDTLDVAKFDNSNLDINTKAFERGELLDLEFQVMFVNGGIRPTLLSLTKAQK